MNTSQKNDRMKRYNTTKEFTEAFCVMLIVLTFIDVGLMLLNVHPIEWVENIFVSIVFAVGYDIGKTTQT